MVIFHALSLITLQLFILKYGTLYNIYFRLLSHLNSRSYLIILNLSLSETHPFGLRNLYTYVLNYVNESKSKEI